MKTSLWRRWCRSLRDTRPRQRLDLEGLADRVTPTLTPQLVLDSNTKTFHSSVSGLVATGPTTYFIADDGIHGRELYKSDGTAAGTVLVKDILPGSASLEPNQLTNVNGTLFFTANDGTTGRELWK